MIGYYVHHHGRGHVTRAAQIARYLDSPVTGLSSLPAPAGWAGPWLRLPRDDEGGPWSGDPTASGVLHWAPPGDHGLRSRMGLLAGWIADAAPSLMVTDVSIEVTLLARLMGVPVAVLAMRGDRDDRPHRTAYDAADLLLAPWPAELPEPHWPTTWSDKTVHVGGVSRFDRRTPTPPRPAAPRPAGPTRRVTLLWGHGDDGIDEHTLQSAEAATPGWRWHRPAPTDGADRVWSALLAADVVVCHGGQNAVAEVAAARRPAVVVAADRPFDEQRHTVAALDRGGLAVGVATGWPPPTRWPSLLAQAVAVGGQGWSRWSDGRGARRAAAALDDLIGRRPPLPHPRWSRGA